MTSPDTKKMDLVKFTEYLKGNKIKLDMQSWYGKIFTHFEANKKKSPIFLPPKIHAHYPLIDTGHLIPSISTNTDDTFAAKISLELLKSLKTDIERNMWRAIWKDSITCRCEFPLWKEDDRKIPRCLVCEKIVRASKPNGIEGKEDE